MPRLPPIQQALREQLDRIADGQVSEIARRARLSVRQLQHMRAGQRLDVKLSTLARIADALGITVKIGNVTPRSRRPAPIGKKPGRPRTMRREPHAGGRVAHDEDEESKEEA